MRTQLSLTLGLSALALVACATVPAAADQDRSSAPAGANNDLAAFPAAVAGQTRHVLRIPTQGNEGQLKVELIVGKTQRIDCNSHSLGGQLEERTAQGWGYSYYVLDRVGPGVSTLMGCPPGSDREAFVRAGGETLIAYNSRLPIVVYTPSDVEVRYRIWRAGAEQRVD